MFNLESLTTIPSLLVGAGFASILWSLLDKRGADKAKAGGAAPSAAPEEAQKLKAELATAREEAEKVADLHSYTRQLEAKLQLLEAANAESGSEEHEMRVKVLEKQLSEKAELESKLAVMTQERDDYKAKAEMFDSMVGEKPAPAPVAPAPEPAAVAPEPVPAREPAPVFAEGEPVAAPAPVEAAAPAPVVETPVAPAEAPAPAVQLIESTPEPAAPAVQPLVAAGGAAVAAKLEAVEEERPPLRVEVNEPAVAIADNRDPLENIDGIGPVYQQKLYEAGIKTFAQLAAASPSRITEIIEPQNWQHIDVMKWRREAALYAAGEKS